MTYEGNYAGYSTSGSIYEAGVCVKTVNTKSFCTTDNEEFYSANKVSTNDWSSYSTAASGTFGLGKSSPIWTIIGSPSTKMFDVYMTNFNSWTWAESDYVPYTQHSIINLGAFSDQYVSNMPSSVISPRSLNSYLFELEEFGFGKTDETAGTEYYKDLKNSDDLEYGFWANSTSLALNFRGLGLPTKLFNTFSNLLSIISKGESTCLEYKSGYCVLSNPCDYYASTGLWDYDFKIKFGHSSTETYLRVPLATFAANSDKDGGVCVIFVEFLDDRNDDSKSIMFGGMFFQSIYA